MTKQTTDPEKETVEKELVQARIKKMGYRKEYLAEQVGLTPSEFSHLISGRRKCYDKEKRDLYKKLGITATAIKQALAARTQAPPAQPQPGAGC